MSHIAEAEGTPESDLTKNKIYHFGDVDAVMPIRNFSPETHEEMMQLVALTESGDVSGIEKAGGMRSDEGRFFLLPHPDGEGRIFVKRKKSSGLNDPSSESFQTKRHSEKADLSDMDQRVLRVLNAHHSILNELSISEEITTLMNGADFQKIVKDSGFDAIQFSEPLFATVNRKTREQYVAYNNIEGATHLREMELDQANFGNDSMELSQHIGNQITDIRKALVSIREFFQSHGFDTHDLQESQLLYEERSNTLYLTDVEGWYKK